MSHPEKSFPDDWPDCCPPDEAETPDGRFYACAKESPFSDIEFRSAFDRNVFKDGDQCRRRGVSILKDIKDAMSLIERYPRNYVHIGTADLVEAHGKILKTKSSYPSHYTLWPYGDVKLHEVFELVSDNATAQ